KIGERRMIQPVSDKALQQIWTPKEWTVSRRASAERHMIAAARSGVTAIQHKFLGAETAQPRLFVEGHRVVHEFAPASCRMNIDLDNPGIRCDLDDLQPRIVWWRITFNKNRPLKPCGGLFDCRDQLHII